ncbi:hypothetical protein HD806DRAFT_289230 [Xylariaceae sp. AK1471]|nr:hypothetical protein HD806DRAFT_289230 [Xylariaceae sp. AK1471]
MVLYHSPVCYFSTTSHDTDKDELEKLPITSGNSSACLMIISILQSSIVLLYGVTRLQFTPRLFGLISSNSPLLYKYQVGSDLAKMSSSQDFTYKSHSRNHQGSHYCTRDYGANVANPNAYHYSNP